MERSGPRPWKSLALALLLIGALQFGRGAWVQAKAWLAQELIAHAWSRTLNGEKEVKPWPWADTWPVARLSVPALGIERYVLEGASGNAFGPGHLSATPVPGDTGNSVIGGHRDTHLAFLRHVRPGDALEIERADGKRVVYRVLDANVLDKRDAWVAKQEGRVTLSHRGDDFQRARERNRAAIADSGSKGVVRLLRRSNLREIHADRVVLEVDGRTTDYPNRYVFILIGGESPEDFLRKIGVEIVEKTVGEVAYVS